jgi:hypothetical protein
MYRGTTASASAVAGAMNAQSIALAELLTRGYPDAGEPRSVVG